MLYSQAETDQMIRSLFGENAFRAPCWMVSQAGAASDEHVVQMIGASKDLKLNYGSKTCHQLMIGEIIVRPHVLVESNDFIGSGLSGMAKSAADMDRWISGKDSKVLLDPMGKL